MIVCAYIHEDRVEKRIGRSTGKNMGMKKTGFNNLPDEKGYFGAYGGRFVPDTLMAPLIELEKAYMEANEDPAFWNELAELQRNFIGRPTALHYAKNLTEEIGGAKIYLKREDLAHTGAHKINNAIGQILLAKRMGKKRIVAETGAGQHGVATAAAAALMGMECVVYMGEVDIERQAPNVLRMELMGARVEAVTTGSKTLKDAVSEAMRVWVSNIDDTYYLLGSALGPHPYPMMVRDFQRVIGEETRAQILEAEGKLPHSIVSCLGGGSNAIGIFYGFLGDDAVELIGVEAGGEQISPGLHAARFAGGRLGIFQGMKSVVLQDNEGQIELTSSISAGLDYASVGPEHALLMKTGRAKYFYAHDDDAMLALEKLSQKEGIIPAVESSHALTYGFELARTLDPSDVIIINISGRGDKDMGIITSWKNKQSKIVNTADQEDS